MKGRSGWMWVSIGLLCILILVSYLAAYYYTEYMNYQKLYAEALVKLQEYENSIFIDIMIDYGNGTREWHNHTRVLIGSSLLNATEAVAKVEYTVGTYGVFVTKINSVGGESNAYWLWYIWNGTGWEWGPVACDAYTLRNGEVISWVYVRSGE